MRDGDGKAAKTGATKDFLVEPAVEISVGDFFPPPYSGTMVVDPEGSRETRPPVAIQAQAGYRCRVAVVTKWHERQGIARGMGIMGVMSSRPRTTMKVQSGGEGRRRRQRQTRPRLTLDRDPALVVHGGEEGQQRAIGRGVHAVGRGLQRGAVAGTGTLRAAPVPPR